MSKDTGINITELQAGVMALELGKELDKAIAIEVYHLKDTGIVEVVKNPVDGKEAGESTWRTVEGIPVRLPHFSTVSFIGCLMIEDINKEINIQRTPEGQYNVSFMGDDDSNEGFLCPYLSEGIARAALFEARFVAAVEVELAAALKKELSSINL